MKNLVAKMLGWLTKLAIMKFKPVIVGITGSVGKTSTRDAVAAVLSSRFTVRTGSRNYNNEFGLPFTVFDQKDYLGKNLFAWIWFFIRAIKTLWGGKYPQVLVLEMGADKPGDISYLLSLTGKIDYAVVTDIGVSHMQNYPNVDTLAKEKMTLAKGIKDNGTAILNIDNNIIANFVREKKISNGLTFGLDQDANVSASEVQINNRDGQFGLSYKVRYEGNVVPFIMPNILGRSNIYAAMASACVGLKMGMNLVEISDALRNYTPPKGRLRLIEGIKNTKIIDDTYNAAPSSTNMALEVLSQIAATRKVAAIGSMAELGSQNVQGHKDVAVKIQEVGVDLVFLVGENARIIKDELEVRHFNGIVKWFENSDNARIPIQNEIREGDTILVKGSRSMAMEKIVKEIMSDPLQAEALLVGQHAQ